jgi:hypothetical protein
MNPDGTVTIGSPLTIRPAVTPTIQPQTIRIINSDDQVSVLEKRFSASSLTKRPNKLRGRKPTHLISANIRI